MKDLSVRAGDHLTASLWNDFWHQAAKNRLVGGQGVLVRDSEDGQIINFRPNIRPFIGDFKVSLQGRQSTIGRGFVNGYEPLIDGIKISGEKGIQPPLILSDTEDLYDSSGRSFIAIEGEIDPDKGSLIVPKNGEGDLKLRIVQVREIKVTGLLGFKEIAVLRRPASQKKGLGELTQIAMFSYQHRTARRGDSWEHFFDPA